MEILNNPGFDVTYALVQAIVVLLLIRLLDLYERNPLWLIGLMALWGGTGAALLALAGNEVLKGLLSGDAKLVWGDVISAPVVEEVAKGAALVAAVLLSRPIARRFGITLFDGVGSGIVYGAAIGLGFAFTEDFFYFLDRARSQGVEAGIDVYIARRDFFGPSMLHHVFFTAAFGAGVGLATWRRDRLGRIGFPLLGLSVAILMHAANNGFIQLLLVQRHGLDVAAAWERGEPVPADVSSTADTANVVLQIIDYMYIAAFLVAIALWLRYQRNVIRSELEEEVESGLIDEAEREKVSHYWDRSRQYWDLVRNGQFEQWQHTRQVHNRVVDLALLKWRLRRWGGDWERARRLRRQIATLKTYEPRPLKLPVAPNPLIGRERELADATALLRQPEMRLVTLTGPGGTGKTRLALAVAEAVSEAFASGVFFVALGPVSDQERVLPAIAQALEVREVAGESLQETLTDYLRDKQLLLVLDNFEQVSGAAPFIANLMSSAERLKVLVTSRTMLHVSGEHEYAVPPLSLPDPESLPDVAGLSRYESVVLFVDRAQAVAPEFTLTDQNAAAVVEVCRRLDGLPLAIELAAARTEVLAPDAILSRLNERLGLLTGGARDLPARHRTLRGTIDWSYELLEAPQQKLFAQLAVFAGGFRIEAAEAVCSVPGPASDLLASLSSLVEKSLVSRNARDGMDHRFGMLETIHEYAQERLTQGGDEESVRQRHAEYHARLAEEAAPQLRGSEQVEWLRRLDSEYENLRTAVLWSLGHGRTELALRIVVALERFWERGPLTEARKWLDEGLRADARLPDPIHAKALHGAGRLALLQADYEQAVVPLEEALTRFRTMGDREGVLSCLWDLAWVDLVRGDYARSQARSEESLALARELDDNEGISRSLVGMGRALAEQGDVAQAKPLLQESLALRRGLGDKRNVANSLSILGRVAVIEGDHGEAEKLLAEALALAGELGDKLREAEALYFLGLSSLQQDDHDQAAPLLAERLTLCRELGDKLGMAECVEGLAVVASSREQFDRAARLFGVAAALRKSIGAQPWKLERSRYDLRVSRARAQLGADEYKAAQLEGTAMTLDHALNYASESFQARAEAGLATAV